MAMTVDTDGKFLLRETATSQNFSKELNTAGKYVDRNIKIDVTAPDGAISADVSVTSGSASMGATGFTQSDVATDYYVSLSTTSGSATGKANVSTSGWVDSGDEKTSGAQSVSVTGNGSKVYIPKATISGTVTGLVAPSVEVSGTPTGFTPSSSATDYYVTVNGAGSNGEVKASASVSGTGMVNASDTSISGASSIAPTVTGSGTKIYIPAGDYSATVASHTISTVPEVTPSIGGTASSISSTTKPSGTDGTDFWTLDPNGSVTKTGKSTASGKAVIGTSGYLPANSTGKTSAASTKDITPSIAAGTNRYISKATTSTTNGTATATAGTASTEITGMVTTTTNTGYKVTASATGGNASVTAASATVGVGYNPKEVTVSTSGKSATGETKTETKYIQKGALSAGVSGNITFTPSVTTEMATISKPSSGTLGTDYFSITGSGTKTGTVTGSASVATEGYVKSETASGGSATGTIGANAVKYIAKAGLSASGTASATVNVAPGAVTIGTNAPTISGGEKLNLTPVTDTSSINQYYIPLKAVAAANTTGTTGSISGTATAQVTTAGYGVKNQSATGSITGSATAKTTEKSSSDYYIPVAKTSYSSALPSGMTEAQFTDISAEAPSLVSGSYLYIKEGYNKNQKISLAKLVPDGGSIVGTSSNAIVSGESAYNNDGVLVSGSLAKANLSGALHANQTTTAGYDFYNVSMSIGHNRNGDVAPIQIPVYQGDWVV